MKYDVDITFVDGKRKTLRNVTDTSGTNVFRYYDGKSFYIFPAVNVQEVRCMEHNGGTV